MEGQPSLALPVVDNSSRVEIDTSRPFRSVKEAVAIFGERLLLGAGHADASYRARSSDQSAAGGKPIYSLPAPPPPKPGPGGLRSASSSPPSFSSASQTFVQHGVDDDLALLNSLKKLELELDDTKRELTQLKERETETEVTVARLSVQLQKSMSALAEIESAKGADGSPAGVEEQPYAAVGKIRSDRWRDEPTRGLEYLPTLAQALSVVDVEDGYDVTRLPKRKPIIPLIGDIFFSCNKNKGSSTDELISRSFYVRRPSFYSMIR